MTAPRYLLRDEAYLSIRGWIVDGTFAAGTNVRDVELAQQLGMSRTPVREAIRRLEEEGLLLTAAARWTRVAAIDPLEAERLYPIVWSLEGLAAKVVTVNLEVQLLEDLAAANRALETAVDAQDGPSAWVADTSFHTLLVDAAANPEIKRLIDELEIRLQRLEIHYFGGSASARDSVREHEAVIAALRARDGDAAAHAIEANWRRPLERLRSLAP